MARGLVAVMLLAALATACDGPRDGDRAVTGRDDATETAVDASAHVDGQDIVLEADGDRRVVATVPDDQGELLHAALRPGEHQHHTVLALTRTDDPDAGTRYELRYVVVDDGEVSDLFWFPWRLQIDPGVAAVLDVPPLPVWSPDGGALAWIEWVEDGTRLRTVGWRDGDGRTNPSDDATAYRLDDVPAGTQLEAWEARDDGDVLVGRSDGERWNIRLHAAGDPTAGRLRPTAASRLA